MTAPVTASETTARPARPRAARAPSWRGTLIENAAVLLAFALAGLVAGWVWQRWATPATGVVLEGTWRLGVRIEGDYLVSDGTSYGRAFGVIGTYVVVCAVGGLVLGIVTALVCRRSELVTLAAVAAGSALAAFLCYRIGLSQGPPDPTVAARTADDATMLSGSLAIEQLSPFVAWPLAALLALAVTYLFTTGASAGASEARRIELGPAPSDGAGAART